MGSSLTHPLNTSETHDTPADRSFAFGLILGGTALGLPIPTGIGLHPHGHLTVRLDDGDIDAVNRWCAYLGMPMPTRTGPVHDLDTDRPWRSFTTGIATMDRVPGWHASVWCVAPATLDEQIDARNELMTAKLAQAEQILDGVTR